MKTKVNATKDHGKSYLRVRRPLIATFRVIDDYAKDGVPGRSEPYVVFTKILSGRSFCLVSYKAKIHRTALNGFTESLSSI